MLLKPLLSFFFYVKCLSLLGKIEMKQFLNFPRTLCLVNNLCCKLFHCFVLKPFIRIKVLDIPRRNIWVLPKDFFSYFTSTIHTSSNFILILIARAISNFSKNDTFLMSRIWKMGRNLFSSLAIKDNLKVAFLEKNSNNLSICLVIGSGFSELSILWNCTTVLGTGCVRNLSWALWASLSVNLALTSCVELRAVWKFFVADCTCSLCPPLSSIDIFLSIVVTKWAADSRKLCWFNLSFWLPDIKIAQLSFENKFFQKMPLSNYLWWPMMNQKNSSIFRIYISKLYDFCQNWRWLLQLLLE